MAEKKIFSIDVAMDEPMYRAIHGLAEADGVSASELMRMLASTLIEERATYYARLLTHRPSRFNNNQAPSPFV